MTTAETPLPLPESTCSQLEGGWAVYVQRLVAPARTVRRAPWAAAVNREGPTL